MTRFNGNKKARIFVAITVMAMVLMSPISSSPTRGVFDHLNDIWESPDRLTAIENDINEINEMISFIEDGDRAITLLDQ